MGSRIEKVSLRTGETLHTYDKLIDVRADGFCITSVCKCINGQLESYRCFGWRRPEHLGLKWEAVVGHCFLIVDGVKVYKREFNNRTQRKEALAALNSKALYYRKKKTEISIILNL